MRVRFAGGFLLAFFVALPATSQDRTVELLEKLANAAGPPGFEEPIRHIMLDLIKPHADSIQFDGLGSIIARQGSQGPRIMVDAHMDELGGVIRRVTNDGYLTMQMLGGWLDQAWWINAGSLSGRGVRFAR